MNLDYTKCIHLTIRGLAVEKENDAAQALRGIGGQAGGGGWGTRSVDLGKLPLMRVADTISRAIHVLLGLMTTIHLIISL